MSAELIAGGQGSPENRVSADRVVGAHDRRTAGRGGIGVIPVSEIEQFDVILGPLVVLVSAATGFYFASKR